MLNDLLDIEPESLNVDFELAVFNAAQKVWPDCEIEGCYFHLSQAILKWIKDEKQIFNTYKNDANFRKNYRQLQALAYVPVEDVITGFNELNNNCVESFGPVLDYFYKTYIGDLKPGGKSRKGRFPITSWNVYNRVLAKRPKTNNNVESWHEKLNSKATKNLTINKLVELLREEQAKVEIDLVQINMGTVVKRKIKQQIKDDRLYYLCKNYDKSNILEYLNNISLNFDIEKIKFKDYKEDE
jgi:hypothetical protein